MNIETRTLAAILLLVVFGSVEANEKPSGLPAPPESSSTNIPFVASPFEGITSMGPRIKFATPIYDFGKVPAGQAIKYSFIFTNIGDEKLILSNVHPSCGCTTTSEWTKQVEPGQTGTIPLQFNSGSYNGLVTKTITVACNDKTQPTLMLQLKGTLWKPVDVIPPYGVLNVPPDVTNAAATVRIVNNSDSAVTLSEPQCSNPAFSVELKTVQPGKEFQLVLGTIQPLTSGSYQGQITLKTSLTNLPVITVPSWINVQAPLSIMPPQINLGQAPLQNRLSSMVTIINNSTNPMTLSEPSINVAGVEPQIAQPQTGKTFTVTMVFPKGFEIPQGQHLEFSAKTSNPKVPVVRVPILQGLPRPNPVPNPVPSRPILLPKPPSVPRPTTAQAAPVVTH